MPQIINGKRKVWNPISRFYLEPFSEWLIEKFIRYTPITPNFITISRLVVGILITPFIYFGGFTNLLIFAAGIQFCRVLDTMDGHLARLTNRTSKYGKFMEYFIDMFIVNIWHVAIAVTLFLKSGQVIWLYIGLFYLFGKYLHAYLALVSDLSYPNHMDDNIKMKATKNPISKFMLFWLDFDVAYHLMSLFAIINRLDWFLVFYAFYYNIIGILYVVYYSYKHFFIDSQ